MNKILSLVATWLKSRTVWVFILSVVLNGLAVVLGWDGNTIMAVNTFLAVAGIKFRVQPRQQF